jgi:hypothetical protein
MVNLRQFLGQLENLRRALKEELTTGARKELRQVVEQALRLMAGRAAHYPQKPRLSGYRRTGTLGRLWTQARPEVTIHGRVIDGRIENARPRGAYVQDPDLQAWMHKGRWQTTDDVVEGARGETEMLLQEAGLRIVERIAEAV